MTGDWLLLESLLLAEGRPPGDCDECRRCLPLPPLRHQEQVLVPLETTDIGSSFLNFSFASTAGLTGELSSNTKFETMR
jgi:hypothetical protein